MPHYDTKTIIPTRRYCDALHELLAAELDMMRRAFPEDAEFWKWGVATVGDFACSRHIEMTFGGDDDRDANAYGETTIFWNDDKRTDAPHTRS